MKTTKDKTMQRKDVHSIASLFNGLHGCLRTLDLIEEGRFRWDDGTCMVRCIKVERNLSEPGFWFATFRFSGTEVRLGMSRKTVLYLSNVNLGDENGVISSEELKTLCYPLCRWRSRAPEFWVNMALVFEFENKGR